MGLLGGLKLKLWDKICYSSQLQEGVHASHHDVFCLRENPSHKPARGVRNTKTNPRVEGLLDLLYICPLSSTSYRQQLSCFMLKELQLLMWLRLMLLWSFFSPQCFLGEINIKTYVKIVATQMSAACVVVLIITATPPNDGAAHP